MTKLTTVLPALQVAAPSVKLPLEAATVVMFMVLEKVNCTWVFMARLLEFNAGTLEINCGAVVSGAIGVAESKLVLPETLPAVSTASSLKK